MTKNAMLIGTACIVITITITITIISSSSSMVSVVATAFGVLVNREIGSRSRSATPLITLHGFACGDQR